METHDPVPVGLRTLLPQLSANLPRLIDEVVALLSDDWPDYAQFVAEDPEDSLRIAEIAVHRLVMIAEQLPHQRSDPMSSDGLIEHEAFEEIGRLEWREGRSLGSLLSAYRAGARVAWQHLSATAVELGLDTASVASLAEAVFIFMEELSSASAHGYVDEQRATTAERERLRAHLAEILVSDRSDSAMIRALALRAGWVMPATATLVVIDSDNDQAHGALGRLDSQSLPLRQGGLTGVILPDPDAPGRRETIVKTLRGFGAVIGTTVPPDQLPSSVRVAEAGIRLARAGILHGDPVFLEDHLDTILVARDSWLLERLRDRVLSPLDGTPAATRRRLEETLSAWLIAMGDHQQTAAMLHVHPQTVRYRLRQIRDLFGSVLDDPQARRRLFLALCWSV